MNPKQEHIHIDIGNGLQPILAILLSGCLGNNVVVNIWKSLALG